MSGHSHEAVYEGGYTRLQINRMGLWLFIISEAFMFLALHAYRLLALGTFKPEDPCTGPRRPLPGGTRQGSCGTCS